MHIPSSDTNKIDVLPFEKALAGGTEKKYDTDKWLYVPDFYSEYRRVRQGVTAWESGNLQLFGKLSFASCESSIHNYECGSPELIAIYEIMRSMPGVYGGRFSGAGFKGACIALVDPAYKEDIEKTLTEKYLEQFHK